MVDSGASVNLVDSKAYQLLGLNCPLKPANTKLLSYGGKKPLRLLGKFQAKVESTEGKSMVADFYVAICKWLLGPRWQSGNTLASHLCCRGSIPVMAVSGKAGSCLPLVGSLQYTTLANSMYWFPLPFQLPVVI